MARYELMYIIPSTLTDEEVGGIETKVASVLTKFGAQVESTKRLGKYRFAYPINHQRHGHYVLVMFTTDPAALAKIEDNLRIITDVLRHLTIRAEEGGTEQKFDLVQYTEVNVDTKEDRPRRREKGAEESAAKEEKEEDAKESVPGTDKKDIEISSEELEKKIESALSDDAKEV